MPKKMLSLVVSLQIAVLAFPAVALDRQVGTLATPGVQKQLVLPPSADNSPVISLGEAQDPQTGEMVEGLAIIHYKKGFVRGGSAKPPKNQCYGFLASGAKWKLVEPWLMNPANTRSLDESTTFANFSDGVLRWEDAADGNIGTGPGVDILGLGSSTSAALEADQVAPDGQNEAYFGSIADNGTIAVTIVWGIFSGPTFQRKLVEWDMIFDQADYDWSLLGEAGKMDFGNIAVHELGHAFGLADLYNTSCQEETMYGYADFGETKKRDLNTGDIQGINTLY